MAEGVGAEDDEPEHLGVVGQTLHATDTQQWVEANGKQHKSNDTDDAGGNSISPQSFGGYKMRQAQNKDADVTEQERHERAERMQVEIDVFGHQADHHRTQSAQCQQRKADQRRFVFAVAGSK